MKKTLSLITLVILSFILASCIKIDIVPENLEITNDVLTWNEILEADKYYVVIEEDEYETFSNEYNLKTLELSEGRYNVSVKAVIRNIETNLSDSVTYVVELDVSSPKNVRLDGTVVSWDEVIGATHYFLYVNNEQHQVTTTSIDLKTLGLDIGNYEIKIKAVKNNKTSIFSEVINYLVAHEIDDETKTRLLSVLDPKYKVNMDERDFSSLTQYEAYLMGVEFVDTYIESASYNNISSENIYELFEKLFDFLNNPDIVNNFTDFIILIKNLEDLGLTGNLVGTLSIKLSSIGLEQLASGTQEAINSYSPQINHHKTQINTYKNSYDYNSLVTMLEKHAITDDEKMALNQLLNTTESKVIWNTYYLINDYADFNDYYKNDFYYENIFSIIKNIDKSNEDDISIVFDTSYILIQIADNFSFLEYYEERINTLNQQITLSNGMLEIFETDYDNVLLAFEKLYDFVMLTKDTLNSPEFILIFNKIMNGQQLSYMEMILIKDVMVPLFKKSIPSKDILESVYKTLIMSSGDSVNVEELMKHASLMAELNTISLEVFIDLLERIDVKYLNDIQEIISSKPNEEFAMLGVVLYTLERYEEFFEEVKTKYDDFLTDDLKEELFVMMFNTLIEQAREHSSEEEVQMLETLRDNFDLFNKLLEQHDDKIIPLIKALIKYNEADNGINSDTYSELLDSVVNEFLNIDSILFTDLTDENVKTVLEILALLVDVNLNEYNDEVESLIDVLISISEIKTNIILEATKLNAKDFFEHEGLITNDYKEMQYKAVYYVGTILNNALTEDTKTEIDRLINILFNDILANDDIKEKLEINNLSEIKSTLITELNDLYDLINTVATLDYNNLSESDWEILEDLVDKIFENQIPPYNFEVAELINISDVRQIRIHLNDEPIVYEIVLGDEYLVDYFSSNIPYSITIEMFTYNHGYYNKQTHLEGSNHMSGSIEDHYEKYYLVFTNNINEPQSFTLNFHTFN